jgi:hypothetical protein
MEIREINVEMKGVQDLTFLNSVIIHEGNYGMTVDLTTIPVYLWRWRFIIIQYRQAKIRYSDGGRRQER